MGGPLLPPLSPGEIVAVQLPPGPVWSTLLTRTWEAEAAVLPVDHRLPQPEVSRLLERGRPSLLVSAQGWCRLDGSAPASPGAGLIVPTSGTRGGPRLVELGRQAVEAAVRASATALAVGRNDPWLSCLPLGHIGGLLVVLRGLLLGCPVAFLERFDEERFARVVDEKGIAVTSLVPTMLGRLLEAGAGLGGLRRILVGGSQLPAGLSRRAGAAGARVVATYGQTESCGGVVYDGRPLEGVGVRLGEGGEIELGGTTVMTGYRHDPEATARALTPDGWVRTGDGGWLEEGVLHVEGGLDDVIVTGGEKVWPSEVEDVLREHPAVADAAVSGRPDPRWGQRVVALVVPTDSAAPPSLEELRAFCRSRLAPHKPPKEIVIRAALPRGGTLGKVRRGQAGRRELGGRRAQRPAPRRAT